MRKLAILMGAMLASTTAANAASTTYTDRSAFNTAAGSVTLVDFNSFTDDVSFQTTGVDAGPFTLTGFGYQYDRNLIDAPTIMFGEFDIDGTTIVNAVSDSAAGIIITFDAPTFAFGADFRAINTTGGNVLFQFNSENVTPANSYDGFFGFVSDTAFTTLTISGGFGDGYSFDNVAVAGSGAVPEPASWAMMIGGFALAGSAMRRRKSSVAFA